MNFLDRTRSHMRRAARAPIGYGKRWNERRKSYTHELAVCAIFREEALFLDEWIAFHAGVGVDHFFLYNNFSSDDFLQVIEPWIARGMVTLTDWPVPGGQVAAYRHCLKRARNDCRWLALIDVDEFLFSPRGTHVPEILRHYRDLPGLEVWQIFFGSGGHTTRPALPVTEAYLKCAPWTTITTAKSIVNPRMVYKVGIHQSKYWLGEGLDTARRRIHKNLEPVLDVLRINHYWSRSIEDLEIKVARGDAALPVSRDLARHLGLEKSLNVETDETIVPIARAARNKSRRSKPA